MHSFLCFSKIGFLHDIDLYLGSLSLENCDFDSKQLSLPVAISACRAAPMGANPLGHTFKPLTLYDISIYTIYFSHPIPMYNRMTIPENAHIYLFASFSFKKTPLPNDVVSYIRDPKILPAFCPPLPHRPLGRASRMLERW